MRSIGNLLISMQWQIPGKNVVWLYDLSVILTSSQHRSEVLTAVAGPSREGVSLTCGNIKPSNPTRKFQPPQRRRRNKANSGESFGRSTSAHTSVFLEAIFSRNGRKIYKILRRIIQAWYLLESTAIIIIVSMAKETTGIRPDDAISAYNGGKLNFPWPTENLNFAPRMRMLNWRPGPLNILFGAN